MIDTYFERERSYTLLSIKQRDTMKPQVTRRVIITYKDVMYELPHKLPNGLRFRILGNLEISGKQLDFIE